MAFGQFQPGQASASPVATGQSYAQSIAGGMPMEQIIAPGVSYSPEQAGGYTQADLDFIAKGPAPVMLAAPTTGEVATIDDQMFSAPVGVPQPTPWIPGQTPFPGIGNLDFLKDLDFSNLPDYSKKDISEIFKDYQDRQDIGEPEPIQSFFTEPSQVPVMPEMPVRPNLFDAAPGVISEPVYNRYIDEQIIPSFMPESFIPQQVPVMPSAPVYQEPVYQEPVYQEPVYQEPVYQIPNFPIQQPMNFTGLPNIPMMPNIPVMPTAPVYIPPQMQAPAYVQPRVEDIISPIRSGSTRRLPQPGLFNLR